MNRAFAHRILTLALRVPLLLGTALAAQAVAAAEWRVDTLVHGALFHGIHGLAFGPDGMIYVGSVMGQSIYRVDPRSGAATVFVPPPQGGADDVAFAPDGTMYWTGFGNGTMNAMGSDGKARVIASGLPGMNSLAFDARGRLFGSQVFAGDALWQFDTAGSEKPRLVAKDLGGLNGFDFGPDGRLCGPLWFKRQIVCMDVETGAIDAVADGFVTPAAANFNSRGELFAIDNETGEIFRIDVAARRRTRVAQAPTNLDNLAFDAHDGLFVTNMSDNAIYAVDVATGALRTVVSSPLGLPGGLAVNGDDLLVADTFTLRAVDRASGRVRDLSRSLADTGFATAVASGAGRIATASFESGGVQLREAPDGRTIAHFSGLAGPTAVAMLDADRLLVTEAGNGGRLVLLERRDPAARQVLAEGLALPMGVATAAGGYVVVESAAGRVIAVDADGTRRVLVEGLARPEGLARLGDGTLAVAETGARRLLLIDPLTGSVDVLARDLPLGDPRLQGPLAEMFPTGVAAAADGTLYLSSDRDGSILRLRRP